jgi:hypothetical protein
LNPALNGGGALQAALSEAGALRQRVAELEQQAEPPVSDSGDDLDLRRRVHELELRIAELQEDGGTLRRANAELIDERARRAGALSELRNELASETARRVEREKEWLAYTRAIAELELPLPVEVSFEAQAPPAETAPESEPDTPAVAVVDPARSGEILRSMRTLLTVEQISGLDLLEAGVPGDGWTGPVVFRLLDGQGRLAGGLFAERMKLEGSRAGRTVTIVLEDGYETRSGARVPFAAGAEGGVRRITLPHVDPAPWLEELSELFAERGLDDELDDGRWSSSVVRLTLNDLLREDTGSPWYRLRHLGGVHSDVLRDVHLEHFDADGALERRLFCDRLTILREDRGVQLLLEDGTQVRGDQKTPFLGGRFRVYLPRADVEAWARAGVPGLSNP